MRKSIIVTGASSGIGKATVIKLVESGYHVFGLARRYDKLVAISSKLLTSSKEKGNNYIPMEFDITKPERFGSIINEILSKAKGVAIYGLVNNAGYVQPGAIEDITVQDLRNQFETNFFGLVEFTKNLLPIMLENNQGRIVNISSISGLISLPLIGAYSASKYAVEAITEALRMELWNTNIRVVTVNPGLVSTNINSISKPKIDHLIGNKSRFSEIYLKYLSNVPKGLPPGSVATAILEAISSQKPKNRYIVGSTKVRIGVRLKKFVPDTLFFSQVAKRIHQEG
ncbi:MAG TPA: SDR family oxidoreductase [Candidatus Nitrosopolaris sp.]|nr:SDR family oxidoreductase [Candidatus Nitrosopolaris sp.]